MEQEKLLASGLDMIYFWKSILRIVPSFAVPVALGILAVQMHSFAGYGGVLLFALPYCAVYCASVYLMGMNSDEKHMVRAILRKIMRKA